MLTIIKVYLYLYLTIVLFFKHFFCYLFFFLCHLNCILYISTIHSIKSSFVLHIIFYSITLTCKFYLQGFKTNKRKLGKNLSKYKTIRKYEPKNVLKIFLNSLVLVLVLIKKFKYNWLIFRKKVYWLISFSSLRNKTAKN